MKITTEKTLQRVMDAEVGCRRNVRRAFTLIEVIVVVVILSIAAGMVVPMISSGDSVQLSSAANKLAADMEYAKSLAISRGQSYSIVFNELAESYTIADSSGSVVAHPVNKGDYIEQFGGSSRLSRVAIADADFDSQNSITFDYLGCPYSGTTTSNALNASGTVTLSAGQVTIDVNVEPITGYISISN